MKRAIFLFIFLLYFTSAFAAQLSPEEIAQYKAYYEEHKDEINLDDYKEYIDNNDNSNNLDAQEVSFKDIPPELANFETVYTFLPQISAELEREPIQLPEKANMLIKGDISLHVQTATETKYILIKINDQMQVYGLQPKLELTDIYIETDEETVNEIIKDSEPENILSYLKEKKISIHSTNFLTKLKIGIFNIALKFF